MSRRGKIGRAIVLIVLCFLGMHALNYMHANGIGEHPTKPRLLHSEDAPVADGAPTVDYAWASEPSEDGSLPPNDAEYIRYRDVVPQFDPLGEVIHTPPEGSPTEVWRDFERRQCARLAAEPPEYRHGTGCHVQADPTGHGMAIDLPPTRVADLDRQQQQRTAQFCARVVQAMPDATCTEIDHDGP